MDSSATVERSASDLRLGIIGLDTSHVVAFTKILNDASGKDHVRGGKVVAAFKSFSADMPLSAERVEQYAAELQKDFGLSLSGRSRSSAARSIAC